MLTTLGRLPWIFLPIIFLVVAHQAGVALEGIAGYIFIGVAVFVLLVEFVKSGDIGVAPFLLDTTFSVLALIVSTALLCYMRFGLGESPTFFHWLGYVIIVGDAILSPANAFRTALRNFGGDVSH